MNPPPPRFTFWRSPRDLAVGLGCAACAAWAVGPVLGAAARGGATPDFTVYWTAARLWLDGGDPSAFSALQAVSPEAVGGPFAYPAWAVLAFLPWALLPFGLAKAVWACATGLLLATGAAVWARLGAWDSPLSRPQDPIQAGVARVRPVLAAGLAWWALSRTVTMGLLPGNLAAVQAGLVPFGLALAFRHPDGLGPLALAAPTALARLSPLLWVPVWWPRGAGRRAVAWSAAAIVAVAVAHVALALRHPWGGLWVKLTEVLSPEVNASLASLVQTFGGGVSGGLLACAGLGLLVVATVGRDLWTRRDPASAVSWITATLLCLPRLPAYEWLVLPGLVAFTLVRVRWTSALPLVGALLLPDRGFHALAVGAAVVLALRLEALHTEAPRTEAPRTADRHPTTAPDASSSGIPASR